MFFVRQDNRQWVLILEDAGCEPDLSQEKVADDAEPTNYFLVFRKCIIVLFAKSPDLPYLFLFKSLWLSAPSAKMSPTAIAASIAFSNYILVK